MISSLTALWLIALFMRSFTVTWKVLAFSPSFRRHKNNNNEYFGRCCSSRYDYNYPQSQRTRRSLSSSSLHAKKNNNKKKLSASEREQRDEEERRKQRQDDVVIGKTSAKRGETDLALDPKSTQQQYLQSASSVEQQVFQLTEIGMDCLKMLQLEEADDAFQKVFELRPNAYLWQAGIVKFYLNDLVGAANIFARSAQTYESRFGGPASEERIWRDACNLKVYKQLSRNKLKQLREEYDAAHSDDDGDDKRQFDPRNLVATIPDSDDDDDMFMIESRKVLRLTRDLFESSICSDMSQEVLARAKLRSIGGPLLLDDDDDDIFQDSRRRKLTSTKPGLDRKLWRLTSWFYLGLHYDTLGERKESIKCMKMALRLCPSSGKSDDIIHTLPMLHMSARDWFDDDDFDTNPMMKTEEESSESSTNSDSSSHDGDSEKRQQQRPGTKPPAAPSFQVASMAYADPVIEESIWEGVSKMKRAQLVDALRLRGLSGIGMKESLRERLFYSLMDDAGFSSGFAP